MKLEKLSAIAEIISSLAILVTLIFLAVQTSQNTRAVAEQTAITRFSVYESNVTSINDWRSSLIQTPELLELWIRLQNAPESGLTPREQTLGNFLFAHLASIFENAFVAYQLGVLKPAGWEFFRTRTCDTYELFQDSLWPNAAGFLNIQFVEYVENNCG